MDPVSVVSLISFAGSCSKLIGQVAWGLKQAPAEIMALNNGVNDLRVILGELRDGISGEQIVTDHASSQPQLLKRAKELLTQLDLVSRTLYTTDSHGKERFNRIKWLVKRAEVRRLKNDFETCTKGLRDLVCKSTREGVARIELDISRVSNQLISEQIKQPADSVAVPIIVEARARQICDLHCQCECHARYGLRVPSISTRVLGQMFVGYVGQPSPGSNCRSRSCVSSRLQSCHFRYTFPVWFVHKSLSVVLGYGSFGEPGVSITLHNRRDSGPLHCSFQLACSGKAQHLQKLLEDRSASPNDITAQSGDTAFAYALTYATFSYDLKPCRTLLTAGTDIRIENDRGRSGIMYAAEIFFTTPNRPFANELGELVGMSSMLDVSDFSPLHKIVLGLVDIDICCALNALTHKTHVDALDIHGRTPLMWAALRGNATVAQALILAGAGVNLLDREGMTPLHFASSSGNGACVATLLAAGAHLDVCNHVGLAPIMSACGSHNNPSIVRMLAEAGCAVDACNYANVSPLQRAVSRKSHQIVEALLELGANINAYDKDGDTALFDAVFVGSLPSLEVLLNHEKQTINWRHVNAQGSTLLHFLASYGTCEVLTLLAPYMSACDIEQKGVHGRSALQSLSQRDVKDEAFEAQFKTLIGRVKPDDDDAISLDSFSSALEMQIPLQAEV